LAKEKRFIANGINRAYERSIHPDLQDNILYYLSDEKTPCIKGEAFAIEHIREGAKHIWKDLIIGTRNTGTWNHLYVPLVSHTSKREISKVLEAITLMGQNFQRVLTAPQMVPHPRIQDFPHQSANQARFTANLLEIKNQGQ